MDHNYTLGKTAGKKKMTKIFNCDWFNAARMGSRDGGWQVAGNASDRGSKSRGLNPGG
jgi:hypothetical protein